MASRFLSTLRGLLLGGLLLLAHIASAQGPVKQWDRTVGGDNSDELHGLQQTADGGYILGGTSVSRVSGEKTQPGLRFDYWLVKLDAAGNKQWDRTFGGPGDDELSAVQQTADGGYILVGTSSSGVGGDKTEPNRGSLTASLDFWVLKVDAAGNKQWDRTLGGRNNDWLACVRQTPDGGYLLGGYSHSMASGDKTEPNRGGSEWWSDYWVVKIDANGRKQWDRTFGTEVVDVLTCLLVMPDGGYLLGGYTAGGVSGDKTQPARGSDFWLVRLDATGNKLWDRVYGGLLTDYLAAMQLTADGGLILAGSSFGGAGADKTEDGPGWYDYWVIKLDANGRRQWDRTLGTAGYEQLTSLALAADGGYLLAGIGNGKQRGSSLPAYYVYDYWVVKLTPDGQVQWDGFYGGEKEEKVPLLANTADGGFIVGGLSDSERSIDKTEPSRGGSDYWVLKFAAGSRPATVFIPNIITPNGDQLNEQFVVQGLPAGCALQVYNRWGREVFRSAAYQNDWGRGAAPGVYYYQLDLPDARRLKGWVEVQR